MLSRTLAVPEREIHQVLSSARRREALEQLRGAGGSITVRELSERVASAESGTSPAPRNVRESVYNSLHQTHLPRLDELGIVEYDDDRKIVTARDGARHISLYMEVETPIGLSWAEYYRSLGVVGLFVVVTSLGELPGVAIVDPLLWGVAFLVLFGLSTGYQLWQKRGSLLRVLRSSGTR
ncbi:hypothetical protein CP556_18405 [Natrinema sp. CBA1119]|uniref:DUF7344 domain-containing protein n=1 Tax=Natrinema sp. CBA1119 TaxID=1608465 RepID=UPI000BF556E0|nr:hypothetical protein [Natrinema sp. CBA1119]PGF17881.1 hypothetical protein CP556_18405 [Natrinema sp. CBA1119]